MRTDSSSAVVQYEAFRSGRLGRYTSALVSNANCAQQIRHPAVATPNNSIRLLSIYYTSLGLYEEITTTQYMRFWAWIPLIVTSKTSMTR